MTRQIQRDDIYLADGAPRSPGSRRRRRRRRDVPDAGLTSPRHTIFGLGLSRIVRACHE